MPERDQHEQLLSLLGTLNSIIEERLAATHDLLEHATEVIRENTEEIGVLRDAIDEFREIVEWAVRNSTDRCSNCPDVPSESDHSVVEDTVAEEPMPTTPDPPELSTSHQRDLF